MGYVANKNLFAAMYDWRVTPGIEKKKNKPFIFFEISWKNILLMSMTLFLSLRLYIQIMAGIK